MISDNESNSNIAMETEHTVEKRKESDKHNFLYTVISIILFFAIYFGWKFIDTDIFKDYSMTVWGTSISDEQLSELNDFTSIKSDDVYSVRLNRIKHDDNVTVIYNYSEAADDFVSDCIGYEYGNIVEDIRCEVYLDSTNFSETVFADSYVNIDNPNCYCLIYSIDDVGYAEFHSDEVTVDILPLFKDSEKMYY